MLEKETGEKFWRIIMKQELTSRPPTWRWMELKEALRVQIHAEAPLRM
jgi:hypothetical protein